MNILFITSSRLGDAILSTGILKELTQRYPHANITIACGSLPAPIFKDWPQVDIFILRRRYGIGHWLDLWRHCIGRRWEKVIDLRGTALSYFLWAKKRFIWKGTKGRRLKARQFSDLLGFESAPYPFLYLEPCRLQKAKDFLSLHKDPFLAIAPAANWKGKEWPLPKMMALIQKIRGRTGPLPDAKILVFASPCEEQRLGPLLSAFPENVLLNCIGRFSFLEIYALMQSCDAFVGNDSGLMHLAAASGSPTLGLFGPSPEYWYAPFGPKTAFVRAPESYEMLWARHKRGENDTLLMANLEVETVFDAFKSLLKQESSRCG